MPRPPARTERIPHVRVRPGRLELIEAAAEERGENVSTFVRQAVLGAARRELRQTPGEGQSQRGEVTIQIPATLDERDRRALLKAASTLQQIFEGAGTPGEEVDDG